MDFGIFEFLTIIFGIGTIIAIVLAYKIKRIDCIYITSLLHTATHPNVEILFNGERISNLFSSKILIFNNGTEAIKNTDIPDNSFPAIKLLDNQRIISYRIISSSSEENNSQIEKIDDQQLQFRFDYLNVKDGSLVELLYESNNDDEENLTFRDVVGKIIGGTSPRLIRYSKGLKTGDLVGVTIAVTILTIMGVKVVSNALPIVLSNFFVKELVGLLIGIALISFGVGSFFKIIERYLMQKLPKFAENEFD